MGKFVQKIPSESVADISGKLVKTDQEITSASQSDVEIQISECFVVSASVPVLPLLIEDAERPNPLVKAQKAELAVIDEKIAKCKAELESAKDEETKTDLTKQIAH